MEIHDINSLILKPTAEMPENLLVIFHRCMDAIEQKKTSLVPGPARIVLVLPGMSKASASARHLLGRNSPKGEIVSDGDDNTQLVSFECLDLTAWMAAKGFLKANVNGEPIN